MRDLMISKTIAVCRSAILLFFPATLTVIAAGLVLLHPLKIAAAVNAPATHLSKPEIIRLGEHMYRDGVLPSGAPVPAFIRGDVEVDSRAFSCSSCHLRAGLGSFEGGVATPPTSAKKLYKPYRRPPSIGDISDPAGRYTYAKTVLERPAYNRETLANALRFGTDPAGQVFNDIMPRYPLDDPEMDILISYLENLSSGPSPGASSREFRFATIITDDVSEEDRQALLQPLQSFIDHKNHQQSLYNDFIKFGYTPTIDMKYVFSQASLDVWELKGAPKTWQSQLEAYNNSRPVFAILGGISNKSWQPIHDFCEAHRLPCLFPITDLPVVSTTGWYTYYFNKGYVQEGEAVANYLHRLENLPGKTPVLQIVQDSPAGRALAAGFESSWHELERPAVTTVTLTAQQLHDHTSLNKLLKRHKPAVLLLWTDAGLLPNLARLVDSLPLPGKVFISSSYMGNKTADIPETVRSRVYITFPYRLAPYVGSRDSAYDATIPTLSSAKDFGDRRITSRTTAMLKQTVLRGLNLLYDNLYRDHLLDIMSTQMDQTVRDYERLSFGPGQRYASKGCYIIQLGAGIDPALLPRSDWVIH